MDNRLWKALSSPRRFTLIAGPCVMESERLCHRVAATLQKTCRELGVTYVFKASYDKANRTSGQSFRGPGLEKGLKILGKIRSELGIPVLTDVHTEAEAAIAAEVVDVLQIPAFLCRQTDMIEAAALTGVILNLKKGQSMRRIRCSCPGVGEINPPASASMLPFWREVRWQPARTACLLRHTRNRIRP